MNFIGQNVRKQYQSIFSFVPKLPIGLEIVFITLFSFYLTTVWLDFTF